MTINKASSVALLFCLLQCVVCVPIDQFYKLGTQTSTRLGDNVDSDCGNSIDGGFRVCGRLYAGLCVLRDGGISLFRNFEDPIPYMSNPFPLGFGYVLIAPFWADVGNIGDIESGKTDDQTLRTRADESVKAAFPLRPVFKSTELFIATWENVVANGGNNAETNTFQAIIATNGEETCVIYNYLDDGIQWGTSGGHHAQVGISVDDEAITHAASGTADIVNIEDESNLGIPGQYVYCIHDTKEEPVTCTNNGIEYQIGEQVLTQCDSKCTCQNDGQFTCVPLVCPAIRGASCYATGDPHYTSFDRYRFNFMGECEYAMVQSCGSNDFVVSANNDACGSRPGISCVRGVRIKVAGSTPGEIYIRQGNHLTMDGVLQPSGDQTYPSDAGIVVARTGGRVHVTLREHGVYVYYDGNHILRIQVSADYKGAGELCGLCGNYNGLVNDDPSTATALSCPGGLSLVNKRNAESFPPCDNSASTVAEAQERCGAMRKSVFSACNAVVDPTTFIEDCEFDYCCSEAAERETFICDALSGYASVCADNGVQPSNWRAEYCPIDCPEGMVFQQCGPFCPQTCDNMNVICEGRCAEGCFCPVGQFLLDGKCVDAHVCTACEYNGVLVEDSQQIQPNCSTKCTCHNRKFECEVQECLLDGPTCYAAGDPHYQTFDLRNFDFQGNCEYVLSAPCDSDEFSVVVRNELHNELVSSTDQVTVTGGGHTIVLGRGNGGTITIDGVLQSEKGDRVIAENDDVQVLRTGGHPNIIFPVHGVRIFYDGLYRVEVTVSTKWQNRLCGLCGNYNGNPSDDLKDRGGNILRRPNDFGTSWIVGNTTGCIAPEEEFCDRKLIEGANARCAALSEKFFEPCNAVISPRFFQRNCVNDLCFCNEEDKEKCYCESLATYAAACAAAGVALPDWRTFYNCPADCPANLLFKQCGSICPQTCNTINKSCISGCAEGCFCPEGQIFNHDGVCVDPSACPVPCPLLTAPDNGVLDCSLRRDTPFTGDSCTFTCDDDYVLSGSATRSCHIDGTWSGTQAACLRVPTCPPLTAPDNGAISCSLGDNGVANVGEGCTFSCDDGYELSGTATRFCQNDQSWTDIEATCTKIPICPQIRHPQNGRIHCFLGDDRLIAHEGDNCTARCNLGYVLSGTQTRVCQSDESWTGIEAVCNREVICPLPDSPENGMISCTTGDDGNLNPGDSCSFICDAGYELSGSNPRVCQEDGSWSGAKTMCSKIPTCPPLTAPDNGDIDCSLGDDGEANPGDTCTFTCDDGYELGGSTSRTCGDDGSWSGTDTTCTQVLTCPPLTAPDNGDIDCLLGDDGEANPGDTCTFTCDDGYELGGSTSRTCGDDGSWSGTDTTCTRVPTCPPLTAPDNGDIDCSLGDDGEANPGDICTFTCDDGYELGGSTSRTCGDDGSWSGTDTTCTRVPTCPPLTAPDNGMINCSLGGDGEANPGDTCTFTCDDGYELGGSTSRTCGDDGNWSGTDTTCTQVLTCPPLTAPDNGDIDCSLGDDGVPHEGDTCSFTCDDGYDLNGTNARTCQNDGTWSGTQAMCSAGTVCPPLTAPDNGMVDCPLGGEGGASDGDSCSVSCDIGFELQGSISRTCQADGIWSGDETTCKEVTRCPVFDAPRNGAVDCSVGDDGVPSIGDECTFTCDDGFELSGSKTRTCRLRRRTGKWSGNNVKCDKVKSCPPLNALDNGVIDCNLGNDGLPTPQDKCTASCNDGFVLSGTATRRCKADETWTGSDAVCTAVDGVTCDPLTAPDNGLIDCSLGGDNVPNEGEACKFSCNDGFQLEGSTSRKCRSSGKWNGRDATCVGGTCPLLSAPDNGQISCSLGDNDEANNGDSCDFTCDDDFVLHGSASRSCSGGVWSGAESLCVPDGACPPLAAPEDGMINCSLGDDGIATEGDTCSVTCDGTFVLRGSSSRACQNDGTWDGTEADCLSCKEVQNIATDLDTTSDSATLTFTAHEDSTFTCRLDRKPKVDCTSPHTFTGLSKGKHKIVVTSKCPGERTGINAKVDFRIL